MRIVLAALVVLGLVLVLGDFSRSAFARTAPRGAAVAAAALGHHSIRIIRKFKKKKNTRLAQDYS